MFAYYGVWSDFVWLMIGAEISAQDWFFFFLVLNSGWVFVMVKVCVYCK